MRLFVSRLLSPCYTYKYSTVRLACQMVYNTFLVKGVASIKIIVKKYLIFK